MTQALTPEVVATELAIPLRTARKWMLRMPGVFRVGKLLRIGRLDFERWISKRKDEQAWASPSPMPSTERRTVMPRTKPRPR